MKINNTLLINVKEKFIKTIKDNHRKATIQFISECIINDNYGDLVFWLNSRPVVIDYLVDENKNQEMWNHIIKHINIKYNTNFLNTGEK